MKVIYMLYLEAKYQLLIKECEDVDLKPYNSSKTFF